MPAPAQTPRWLTIACLALAAIGGSLVGTMGDVLIDSEQSTQTWVNSGDAQTVVTGDSSQIVVVEGGSRPRGCQATLPVSLPPGVTMTPAELDRLLNSLPSWV